MTLWNRSKICIICVMLLAILSCVGCGPGTGNPIYRFDSFEEYTTVFKDVILFPTYLPEGYERISGQAVYRDTRKNEPKDDPSIYSVCVIVMGFSYDKTSYNEGGWRFRSISIECRRDKDSFVDRRLPDYSTVENEEPYEIYSREYIDFSDDKTAPPYGVFKIEYAFLDESEEDLYNLIFFIDIKDKDFDITTKKEIKSYCLDEAIKIYESLSVFADDSIG